ncbi:MAG: hypothetical protein KGN16_02255 [Burkholderiales bacterium]|nr:hypothetical protein [Burkholderiales bacterium]
MKNLQRLEFLAMYVGSAALVAFLAASLSWPQIATYSCPTSDGFGIEQCEADATLDAAAPAVAFEPAPAPRAGTDERSAPSLASAAD